MIRSATAQPEQGPLARMTMSEAAATLRNPYALRLLMDYQQQQFIECESMSEPGECGRWPTARWTALYERGRSIMVEDLKLWDADLLRDFGFPEQGPQPAPAAQQKPFNAATLDARDAARYRWLRDWLVRHGLLHALFCRPPGAPVGDYWVLRSPAVVNGSDCLGYGKSEDAAIEAALQSTAQEPQSGTGGKV